MEWKPSDGDQINAENWAIYLHNPICRARRSNSITLWKVDAPTNWRPTEDLKGLKCVTGLGMQLYVVELTYVVNPVIGQREQGPCDYNDDNDYCQKGDDRWLRRLPRQEPWLRSPRHVIVCVTMIINYYMEEEERLTTTGETTDSREGTATTTMTRTTVMSTGAQDRREERKSKRDTATPFDDAIRLLSNFRRHFSQFSILGV